VNSTDPVEQRTAKSVVFLFMTPRPTNWVNCCSRCRVELSCVAINTPLCPDRRERGNKRCFCPSLCLSVRPPVAYVANNSRTQRPSVPKFGRKVPHLRCDSHTSFKIKRSKLRVTDGRGHTVSAEPGGHTACNFSFTTAKRSGARTRHAYRDQMSNLSLLLTGWYCANVRLRPRCRILWRDSVLWPFNVAVDVQPPCLSVCVQVYKVEIAFGERNVVIFRSYKEITAFTEKVGTVALQGAT